MYDIKCVWCSQEFSNKIALANHFDNIHKVSKDTADGILKWEEILNAKTATSSSWVYDWFGLWFTVLLVLLIVIFLAAMEWSK